MSPRAAAVIRQKTPDVDLIIVDQNQELCRKLRETGFHAICMDGIDFLIKQLSHVDPVDWIVPAVPIHLAFEWVHKKISPGNQLTPMEIPDRLIESLPNPIKGELGTLYVSNADFICPENCPEPNDRCTFTGLPRPQTLYKVLSAIQYKPFRPVVVVSRQIHPGVGGYSGYDLFKAFQKVMEKEGPLLFSTACRCHAVIHAFEIKRNAMES